MSHENILSRSNTTSSSSGVLVLILASMLVVCSFVVDYNMASLTQTSSYHYALAPSNELSFCAFNIQILGKSKMEKQQVVSILLKILSRYDIIFVQEIRDGSDDSFASLVKALNQHVSSNGKRYDYKVSERLGRSASKEQYGFIYNPDKVKCVKTIQFEDTDNWFERAPFTFVFEFITTDAKLKGKQFAIIGCHIRPSAVAKELNYLTQVYDSFKGLPFYQNTIITGDFNADCSYLSKTALKTLTLNDSNRFKWLLDEDSTVADSACSYDRFVVPLAFANSKLSTSGFEIQNPKVFRYESELNVAKDLVKLVSDHYPIELKIQTSGKIGSSTKTLSDLVEEDISHNYRDY
ncbi:hypothetical protein C9374_008011 [Naegleria lovaniensis]|uniref:Endonuclease/exonuclease/phosphatase domain-containing protein n=1 Tax=Naegleria lovaniensis TaxID=51637 RepID=A0AA88GMB6_NAELO|nr:uncharacterized protein C9374_008011 [Naegleria lovaniensis]KAG2378863.1 hypothetical protein C9374_008011 [Naegleria lovaniensis]